MKHTGKKKSWKRFFAGLALYALIFSGLAVVGLRLLWDYMEDYEGSRSNVAVENYMESLDREKIISMAQESVSQLDSNICPADTAGNYIADVFYGNIKQVKNGSESSEEKLVYDLRWNSQRIGSFTIEKTSEDKHGFPRWSEGEGSISAECMFESNSISVPENYTVVCNGYALDDSYVVDRTGELKLLEGEYENYQLPHIYTYEFGPYVGGVEITVLDETGTATEYDETDYLDNCSEDEKAMLDKFIDEFVLKYTEFTGTTRGTAGYHYSRLMSYVVTDSEFAQRITGALSGMQWSKNLISKLTAVSINGYYKIDESHYFCDLSYDVETDMKDGTISSTHSSAKVVMRYTGNRLLVETFFNYNGE